MATRHVAGLAAHLASRDDKFAGPYLVDDIYNTVNTGYINNQYDDTVNRIAFNGNPKCLTDFTHHLHTVYVYI